MSFVVSSLITSNRGGAPVTFQYSGNNSESSYYVWRSYDGSGNNIANPTWGAVHIPLLRQANADYADGLNTLAERGTNNPNPRSVSNAVCAETTETPSTQGLSNMIWAWGQFLDHEIDLTESNSAEPANMVTPDVKTDPNEQFPGLIIPFNRSNTIPGSGLTTPRQQPNEISAYIDGTNVYGYSSSRASALRLNNGSGKLRTTLADNLEVIMPYNSALDPLPNAQPSGTAPEDFFVAGDIRANENVVLTGMHTLFVREHNRLCDEIVQQRPEWLGQDELIFQHARSKVIAQMQHITYNEFLPALFAPGIVTNYQQYDENVNASVKTEFSTAVYRLGHSMIASRIQKGSNSGNFVLLRDVFFAPAVVQQEGVDTFLLGNVLSQSNEIDGKIIDDLRNFLFGPPGPGGMMHDLASINMQRGRDHGIPGYNDVREAYGLSRMPDFSHFVMTTQERTEMEALYNNEIDAVDPWIGGLLEPHVPGAAIGELIQTALWEQFQRLRDGDRFWFERDPALTEADKAEIRNTRLSDVLIRNTSITESDIPTDVFRV